MRNLSMMFVDGPVTAACSFIEKLFSSLLRYIAISKKASKFYVALGK